MKKHFTGQACRVPWSRCTGCGKRVDGATPIDDETATPDPGDVTVCIYCGHVMAYTDDLQLRDLTDAETRDIEADEKILAVMQLRTIMLKKRPLP
jgi:hypothetical protein